MTNKYFKSRPRIIGSNAGKYIGREVTVLGEITQITPRAHSLTLRMPDDEGLVVLLDKALNIPVELHLLTEVSGKLISKGQIEATWVRQYDAKQTSIFNRNLYVEAAQIYEAYREHYDF